MAIRKVPVLGSIHNTPLFKWMKVPMTLFQGNGLFSLAVWADALAWSYTSCSCKVEVDSEGLFSSSKLPEQPLVWIFFKIKPHYLSALSITHASAVCLT